MKQFNEAILQQKPLLASKQEQGAFVCQKVSKKTVVRSKKEKTNRSKKHPVLQMGKMGIIS